MVDEQLNEILHAANEYDWLRCESVLAKVLQRLENNDLMRLAVEYTELHIEAFVAQKPSAYWVVKFINGIKNGLPPSELETIYLYEEDARYDVGAFILMINEIRRLYLAHVRNQVDAVKDIINLSTVMSRYRFWASQNPDLIDDFYGDDENFNSPHALARLSYAHSKPVNEFVKDIWFKLVERLKSWF